MKNNNVKLGVTIGFFIALLVYHYTRIQTNFFFKDASRNDVLSFWTLAETLASFTVFAMVVYSKIIPWAMGIFGGFYVDGKYEGYGFEYDQKNMGTYRRSEKKPQYIERYIIKQNLFEISISGESFEPRSMALISTWHGKLYQIEGENMAYFGINLIGGHSETGILTIKFEDNEAHGFYHSGRPGNQYAYASSCKKVKSFSKGISTIAGKNNKAK